MTRFYHEGKWYDLDEILRKADLWDQYAIYDNDNEPEILVKDLITVYEIFKDIKEFVIGRRWDIENEIEDLWMLKLALDYFLEAED